MLLLASRTQERAQAVRLETYQYSTFATSVAIILDFLPIVLAIIFAATANRMAGRKYLRHGWEFAEPNSDTAQTARTKWGILAP